MKILIFYVALHMYSKSSNRSRPRRSDSGRWNNGGQKPFPKPFNKNNNNRRRFTGNFIDIRLFTNKAVAQVPVEETSSQLSFADFQLVEKLKNNILAKGYKQAMPIQEKTIPLIMQGKDLIGLANTGTGKTAAFLIPMINKMLKNPLEKLLVVAPTRELALQIQEEFVAFTQGLRITSVVTVGGANIRPQIIRLRNRPNVVIGTPGRIKDLIDRKALYLDRFTNVVLDEADQMLDMGFLPDVKYLLSLVAEKRQTLLFSATLPSEIEKLIHSFLKDPVKVSIKTRETSANVDQDVVRLAANEDKVEKLHALLVQETFHKVLIFTRTKHGADKLSKILFRRGFKAESIHGDKPHARRQKALKMFKEDFIEILVATDIAARGLDIPDVSHVINYDLPASYEDYIHRIGRTGRATKKGKALTFIG